MLIVDITSPVFLARLCSDSRMFKFLRVAWQLPSVNATCLSLGLFLSLTFVRSCRKEAIGL